MAQFIGPCLVSWGSRKQNSITLSTTEAEYIAIVACYSKMMWLKKQLHDYVIELGTLGMTSDNTSSINVSKILVHHFKTKYIDVLHDILRDHVKKGNIDLTYYRR